MPQHRPPVIRVVARVDERRGALVAASLRSIDADLGDLTRAHRRIGRLIAARARQLVPVRTGRLRRSLRAFGDAESAGVSNNADIAYWTHIVARGHPLPQGGSVPATDFDIMAVEQTRPNWERAYSDEIDRIIAEHGLDI